MTINEKIEDNALSWIMKEKEGLTPKEGQELNEFLKNSLNQKAYYKYQNLYNNFSDIKEEDILTIEQEIIKNKKKFQLNKIFLPFAASILVVSFLSYFYYESQQILYQKHYQTYVSKKVNIHLPDDSLIDLDAKSNIDIKYYQKKRFVNFSSGKAVFSVHKNKQRPFFIKAGNTQIEVIGTKFEVIKIEDKNTINVIEGIVRISYILNHKIKHLIVLEKGQSFSLDNKGKNLKLKKVNIVDIAKWKDDLIRFDKTTLKEAFKEFARYTDKKILLKDYRVSNFKISGIFSIKDLNKFINSLSEIYDLNIIKKQNEIILSST